MDRPWVVSESASLLAQHGLLPRLRSTCLMLASADGSVMRSVTLSLPVPGGTSPLLANAVCRLAQEYSVQAAVEMRPDRLIVRLYREFKEPPND